MKNLLLTLLLLALMKPVFLGDASESTPDASEGSGDASEGSGSSGEGDSDGDGEAAGDGEGSNLFWWRDHYGAGYHRHYGYYGCCDMNYWGRTKCCYYRPWSACCGGYGYYTPDYDHDHHNDHHHDHHNLVLKTKHSHFDSSILSSSKSTVSLGGHYN